MTREELFNEWVDLGYRATSLKGIVQNEDIMPTDVHIFLVQAKALQSALSNLVVQTIQHLAARGLM